MGFRSRKNIQELIKRYELANLAEGKSPKTVKGYNELLRAFYQYSKEYLNDTTISCFTINTVREYILYLHTRPKFQGHPFTPARGNGLSVESIRDHIRTLKAFSTWLYTEGYTGENRLKNLKLPKPEDLIIQPLTEEEITIILDAIDQKTPTSRRNYAIVVLMLDTGLRVSEVVDTRLQNFNRIDGCIKVMGKGKKERIVPVGTIAQTALSEYITYVRSKIVGLDCDRLFVSENGSPITENALKLLFSRLSEKSGITRLHAHLCRRTFAINYLLNGGDIFSLKEILGHKSLEMVNHYLHFTKAQITARHHEFSPMDRLMGTLKKQPKLKK